jgi:hypothetical protein
MQNVQGYLEVVGAEVGPAVLALSSGFMTYATDVHPHYARVRGEIAVSATTLVLLPSLDYETCVWETVRRQLERPFRRSAEREEQVIRERFDIYRNLSAAKLETMNHISEVVDAAVANLLPNIRFAADGGRRDHEPPRLKPDVVQTRSRRRWHDSLRNSPVALRRDGVPCVRRQRLRELGCTSRVEPKAA